MALCYMSMTRVTEYFILPSVLFYIGVFFLSLKKNVHISTKQRGTPCTSHEQPNILDVLLLVFTVCLQRNMLSNYFSFFFKGVIFFSVMTILDKSFHLPKLVPCI